MGCIVKSSHFCYSLQLVYIHKAYEDYSKQNNTAYKSIHNTLITASEAMLIKLITKLLYSKYLAYMCSSGASSRTKDCALKLYLEMKEALVNQP